MFLNSDHESNLFSSIAGLPLHPLVVHLAVVALPAAALALIVLVAVPRWRRAYGWLSIGAALLGTGGAFLAKESGEALADQVGLPASHAEWGDRLFAASLVFAAVAVVWFAVDLRSRRRVATGAGPGGARMVESDRQAASAASGSTLGRLTGGALVIVSVAVLALTVVVGHSGATAVWDKRGAVAASGPIAAGPVAAPSAPSSPPVAGGSASAKAKKPGSGALSKPPTGHTMADVAAHHTSSSCWVAIAGQVYDLTTWIDRHPGGPEAIRGICGTDASSAFANQHAGQSDPARALAKFSIGKLR